VYLWGWSIHGCQLQAHRLKTCHIYKYLSLRTVHMGFSTPFSLLFSIRLFFRC
jgi:hypothetical protein